MKDGYLKNLKVVERDVLGTILLKGNSFTAIINDLRTEDFYFKEHKELYSKILKNSNRIGHVYPEDLLPNKTVLYYILDCITSNFKIKILWLVEQSVDRRIGSSYGR